MAGNNCSCQEGSFVILCVSSTHNGRSFLFTNYLKYRSSVKEIQVDYQSDPATKCIRTDSLILRFWRRLRDGLLFSIRVAIKTRKKIDKRTGSGSVPEKSHCRQNIRLGVNDVCQFDFNCYSKHLVLPVKPHSRILYCNMGQHRFFCCQSR